MDVASGSMNGSQPIQTCMVSATFMNYPHENLVGLPILVVSAKVPAYRASGRDFGRHCVENSSGGV